MRRRDFARFACIVGLSVVTTFWTGSAGFYLMVLWVICVLAYARPERAR
jgi:hypothetical protein